MKLEFWEAVATMIGVIIGAGIFGIPYVVAEAGFLTGLLVIVVLGAVVGLLYLQLGEVVLRTKGKHQLTGYAEKYLGRWGKHFMLISMIVGLYGALIAYLIGEGASLYAIFGQVFGGRIEYYMIFFFVIVAVLLYFGLEALEKSELVTVFLILVVVLVIIAFTIPHVNASNLNGFDVTKFFVPFGVVLFAYLGLVAVPEASEILAKDKKRMKLALVIGMTVPVIVYLIFTFVVVGSISLERFNLLEANERIATIALGEVIGSKLFIFANIFAILAMFTSFMAVGFALKEMFTYDYKIPKRYAWALTCFIPLLISLYMVLKDILGFIGVINITGVVAGGIGAILVLLMFHKAKKSGERKPEYVLWENRFISFAIAVMFIAGAVFLIF